MKKRETGSTCSLNNLAAVKSTSKMTTIHFCLLQCSQSAKSVWQRELRNLIHNLLLLLPVQRPSTRRKSFLFSAVSSIHSCCHLFFPKSFVAAAAVGTAMPEMSAHVSLLARFKLLVVTILQFFVFDTFTPQDTFEVKSRKAILAAYLGATAISLPVPWWLYRLITQDAAMTPTEHGVLALMTAAYILYPVIVVCVYMYMRRTKTASGFLCFMFIGVSIALAAVPAVCHDAYPHAFILTAIIYSVALTHAPHGSVLIGASVLVVVYKIISDATGGAIAVPGLYTKAPLLEIIFMKAVGLFCFILTVVLIAIVSYLFRQSVDRAEAAADLSRAVAARVLEYNVDGLKSDLAAYAENPLVDQDLLSANKALAASLELYRPHLPDYLFAGDDEEGEAYRSADDLHRRLSDASQRTPKPQQPDTNRSGIDAGAAAAGHDESSSCSANCNPQHGPKSPIAHDVQRGAGGVPMLAGVALVSQANYHGKVSVFSASVVPLSNGSTSPPLADDGALRNLVAQLHDLAAQFHASIHSFVGDELVASWNGTRRVAQPEVKAAQFMLGLQGHLRARSGSALFDVVGSCVTGAADACFIGDDRRQLFTLSLTAPMRDRLAQLRHLGWSMDRSSFTSSSGGSPSSKASTLSAPRPLDPIFLFDIATWDASRYYVAAQAIDTLGSTSRNVVISPASKMTSPPSEGASSPLSLAFELVGSTDEESKASALSGSGLPPTGALHHQQQEASHASEWMYVVDAMDHHTCHKVTQVATLFATGKKQEAVTALRELDDSSSGHYSTVGFRHLRQRLLTTSS